VWKFFNKILNRKENRQQDGSSQSHSQDQLKSGGSNSVPKSGQESIIYDQKFKNMGISKNIQDNIANIKGSMNNNFDIRVKEFKLGSRDIYGVVIYVESLANEDIILQHVVSPLMLYSPPELEKGDAILFNTIKDSMVIADYIKEVETLDEILFAIMSGDTFLCVQGYQKGFIISSKQYVGRQIGEPILEPSVRGSQEGFSEILKNNIGLIRKRIRDPNLVIEAHRIGRRSEMEVLIVYLKDVANQAVVNEATRRITALDVDSILCTAELGLYITDDPNSIFPLYQITERPDRAVRGIMEGRVAIFMEGGTDALLVPVTMPILLQSADDYYENWFVVSVLRLIRYGGMLVSTFLPALYIALTTFHTGMLPLKLVLTITGARGGVPFPGILEAVLLLGSLELLHEASIRLSRVIGQTVSIVGGLVIGQAAVQAGLVGPIMIIIIGLTAIGAFAFTDYSLGLATRMLRIPFMILSATLGIFGVAMGMLILLIYVASLESFGVRYIRPLSPYRSKDIKETVIKGKDLARTERSTFLYTSNEQRQSPKGKKGEQQK
jgi:spore germination protein